MTRSTNNHNTVLKVKGLGKEYKLYASPRDRLKALVTGNARHRSHWALRDVSFELQRGQCIGVIGDNGAGKSSLLKLLAGTLQPSRGSIERVGESQPFWSWARAFTLTSAGATTCILAAA